MAVLLQISLLFFCANGLTLAFIGTDFKPELQKPPATTPAPTSATTPTTKTKQEESVDTFGVKKQKPKNFVGNNIPIDLLHKLRAVNDMNDFIRIFNVKGVKVEKKPIPPKVIDPPKQDKNVWTVNVDDGAGVTRMAMGGDDIACQPRSQVVSLPQPADYGSMYYPFCVTANRCGGCCGQNRHVKCLPSTVTKAKKAVFRVHYKDGITPTTVEVEEHGQCKCQCSLTKTVCGPYLELDKDLCLCKCNKDAVSCANDGPLKQWSPRDCKCICTNKVKCPENRFWDEELCRCRCTQKPCPTNWARDRNTCLCSISLLRSVQSFKCVPVDDKD